MRIGDFFRKLQFVAMLALGSYPAACVIIFIAPELLQYMWLFPVAYSLFCLLAFALPAKLRLALGILGAALIFAPSVLLLTSNARNIVAALSLGYGALLIWSMRIPGLDSEQELPLGALATGFVLLLFGCLLSFYEPRLETVKTPIRISFFLFAFFAMLSLNRGSLQLAAGGQRGFSPAMRHKNVLLTVGMFAIALAVGLIPSVLLLFKWLFASLGAFLEKVAELFPKETLPEITTTETTVGTTGEGMGALFEDLPVKRTPRITYIMMAAIALAFMIPVGGYAIYKIATALWKGALRLAKGVVAAAGYQMEDFQDEITDTREDAEAEYYREKKEQKEPILPNISKMTPTEQIRYRYKQMSQKQKWKQHHTARENLPETAARLYERARYSDHPVTQQDAEAFKNETK